MSDNDVLMSVIMFVDIGQYVPKLSQNATL